MKPKFLTWDLIFPAALPKKIIPNTLGRLYLIWDLFYPHSFVFCIFQLYCSLCLSVWQKKKKDDFKASERLLKALSIISTKIAAWWSGSPHCYPGSFCRPHIRSKDYLGRRLRCRGGLNESFCFDSLIMISDLLYSFFFF